MKLLAAKLGWFGEVDPTAVTGQQRYLRQNKGQGGELLNFVPDQGCFYGYVKGKLGSKRSDGSQLDSPPMPGVGQEAGWTIVFLSADQEAGGQRLNGWYECATLVHQLVDGVPAHCRHPSRDTLYCAQTTRAFFVPPELRTTDLTQGSPQLNSTSFAWLKGPRTVTDFGAITHRVEAELARLSRIIEPLSV